MTALLVMTVLVSWQGIVLSIPHNHSDSAVPQEELLCSASRPSSDAFHLHAKGQQLSPHPCIACLAGWQIADEPGSTAVEGMADQGAGGVSLGEGLRSRFHSHLPPDRGPPSLV